MKIEIECPEQFQGSVVGDLISRRGMVWRQRPATDLAPDRGRSAAGRDLRLLDRPAEHDAGPGHVHDGIARYRRVPPSIQEEIVKRKKEDAQAGSR